MSRSAGDCPEFALLLRCCQWNFAERPDERPELSGTLDWPHFVELARFHRVQGLAWNALAQGPAPPDAAEALSAEARSIAATNLASARECSELVRAFARADIPLLFLKGLTVAALAYRSPMLKMGWDIDVLVAKCDLIEAAAILAERAYRRTIPSPATNLANWHSSHKESVWARPKEHLYVELHTRLADNDRLIPTIGVESPRRDVGVLPGVSLPTLGPDELFAYLCVHGASSLWFRLKWITDLAALLHKQTLDIEHLYRRSQELGAGRSAGQALLLADALYGSLADAPHLRDELARDPFNRWLAKSARKQLAASVEPTSRLLGTTRIHLTQFGLLPGLRFKLSELLRQTRVALP